MRKLLNKKFNVFGKSVPVFVIALIAIMGLATAALLPYFGQITGNIVVDQGLYVDGRSWDDYSISYEEDITSLGGIVSSSHYLENKADVDAEVSLGTVCSANVSPHSCYEILQGISYHKYVGYHLDETVTMYTNKDDSTINVDIVVEEVGDWIQWTYTFSDDLQAGAVNIDHGLDTEISIHNNDGQDGDHSWGTWLYNHDGTNVGENNELVESLWWVTAEGERNGDNTYIIKIHKSKISDCFHWHASITPTGGPMYSGDYDSNSWGNFIDVCLWENLAIPFTVPAGTTLDFAIVSDFPTGTYPGLYTLKTEVTA